MKKPKSLEQKLEPALRLIWRGSAERRAIIKAHTIKDPELGGNGFTCPSCGRNWPIAMADVDHEPPLGGLQRWEDVADYIKRLFWGPQKLMCKICHKKKTAAQRKKRV